MQDSTIIILIMKISFDFDHTLDRFNIQKFATSLHFAGHEIWIVTKRFTETIDWNADLYNVAELCNIPAENIVFTEDNQKYPFLKNFDIHFDDCEKEIELINKHTNCKGVII